MSPGSLLRSAIRKLAKAAEKDTLDLPIDFNAENYLALNPDLDPKSINPFEHYALSGKHEGRPYKAQLPAEEDIPEFELPADFDPEVYRGLHPDLVHYTGDLTHHYLNHGAPEFRKYNPERLPLVPKVGKYGLIPEDFDPDIYLDLNRDIIGQAISPHDHFVEFGLNEKRLYRPPLMIPCIGKPHDATKPTILLVSHEATRTGAPILSWNIARQLAPKYNLVILLLGKGALLPNFQEEAEATYLGPRNGHSRNLEPYLIRHLLANHTFDFALLNSIETAVLCKPLAMGSVPSILLIHEFAANTRPREKFLDAMIWASLPVFSTNLTKNDAVQVFPGPIFENALVLPQGRCAVPPDISYDRSEAFKSDAEPPHAGAIPDTPLQLVIGIGSVCLRKGIDIFIEVASQMQAAVGRDRFEFLWVGGGYPDYDPEYSAFLADQIQRSELTGRINIVSETDDLEALYERASLLLLTSRLDPLPNIAIDAICTGLPMVCFSKASGIADVLRESGLEEWCVARYIDPSDMAQKAVRLADEPIATQVAGQLKSIGDTSFSLPKYCLRLQDLQNQARERLEHARTTVDALMKDHHFDAAYCQGAPSLPSVKASVEREYCWEYVTATRAGAVVRKPSVGFNPLVYRERLELPLDSDPLLHHVQSPEDARYHKPKLITPKSTPLSAQTPPIRTALHLHAYYVDMVPEILDRLLENSARVDIFITVDTPDKETRITRLLNERGTEQAAISIRPNEGRDVYPFLRVLDEIKGDYDVIGHVHTKKSPHVKDGSDLVSRWRSLLLGNLLGSEHCPAMLDRILNHFAIESDIDIIFPDDPHIIGWGKNAEIARDLIGDEVFEALPKNFDFPVGTMFWARSDYLQTIAKLDVQHRFSPKEPLPIDGTILHAWERVLGAMVAAPLPRYALTYVPGLSR